MTETEGVSVSETREFTMVVAGHTVRIRPLHDRIERLAADYLAPDRPKDNPCNASASDEIEATFTMTQEAINQERSRQADSARFGDAYLETLAVQRALAEWGPRHGFFLMHGAVIEYAGHAYLFTAPSGTGKTTHVRLWQEHLGNRVAIINGDKPFIRRIREAEASLENPASEDDRPLFVAYGTPWAGKEGWHRNTHAPLAGIAVLRRGTTNALQPLSRKEIVAVLASQVYLPTDPDAAGATLEMFDEMATHIPFYQLTCDISEDAVRTSFEGMTGERYPAESEPGTATSEPLRSSDVVQERPQQDCAGAKL